MPETRAGVARKPRTGPNPWVTLAALAAGYFLILVDQGLMPVITPRLPFDVGDAVWLTSVYLLCTVVPMPVTGRLGDKYGQRPVFLTGLCVYVAALGFAAASTQLAGLVVARAIQGLGSAVFLPQAFGMINRIFPQDGRGRAFAAWGVIGSVASLTGPVVGGAIVDAGGWRAGFIAQAVLGVIAVCAAFAWVPRLPASPALIDVASVALSFAGLGLLIYGIQYGALLAVALGLAGVAVVVVRGVRGKDKGFLPVGLFRDGNFAVGTLGVATMGFTVASMFIPLMYWVQTVSGVSSTRAGLLTAPMSVVALALTPVAGVLADKVSPKVLCVFGFGTMSAALAATWVVMRTGSHPGWIAVLTALYGLGSAFIWAPNATTTMRSVPDEHASAASGLYNTIRQVGSVLGVALVGAVLVRGDIEHTVHTAMLLPLTAMLVGAVSSLMLRSDVGLAQD